MRELLNKKNLWVVLSSFLAVAIFGVACNSEGVRTEFVELEQSTESRASVLESIQPFRINGVASSDDWISEQGNTLSVTGFINGGGWDMQDEIQYAMIFLPEELEGVMVYHILPFFVAESNTFVWSDLERPPSNIDVDLIIDTCGILFDSGGWSDRFPQGNQLARLDFSVHDGWIKADKISMYQNLTYVRSEAERALRFREIPDSKMQYKDAQKEDSGAYWLDISEGDTYELTGVVDDSQKYLRISSKLGSAVMYHFVRIDGLEDSNVEPLEEVMISVTLRGDRLIFAE
ncbi:MAG: hypothetical protein FWE26_05510 [Coriobacteriia bacterium]|nr:hypothetical protein [Coriobacteriia bacterium]